MAEPSAKEFKPLAFQSSRPVWHFVGDAEGAAVRSLAAVGGSGISAALIFGWYLLKFPAVLEGEAENERLRILAQLESENQQRSRREALGESLGGRHLLELSLPS